MHTAYPKGPLPAHPAKSRSLCQRGFRHVNSYMSLSDMAWMFEPSPQSNPPEAGSGLVATRPDRYHLSQGLQR